MASQLSPLLSPLGIVALAGVVVPVACKGDGNGAPPIDDVADILDIYQGFYSLYCECYGELYGYSDAEIQACLSGLEIASDAEIACLNQIFDANPEQFEVLRCQGEALRGLLACARSQGCPEAFECGDGSFVPESSVCDGFDDCINGADEQQSCPAPPTCADDGRELFPSDLCDGFEDCTDASDEANCPDPFVCGDGNELPADWVCDGFPQCADGSDEQQGCPTSCESQWFLRLAACGELSEEIEAEMGMCFDVSCGDGTEVPAAQRCDGNPDCPNGEDEFGCESNTTGPVNDGSSGDSSGGGSSGGSTGG